jgi:hypothetical protein
MYEFKMNRDDEALTLTLWDESKAVGTLTYATEQQCFYYKHDSAYPLERFTRLLVSAELVENSIEEAPFVVLEAVLDSPGFIRMMTEVVLSVLRRAPEAVLCRQLD